MRTKEIVTEAIKQRLDAKCWKGKHKEGTKIKGGVRVNNCVPNEGLEDPKDNPCWSGYKPVGTKKKGGKTVPNCVPKESVEESEKRCPQCGSTNCKCAPGKCNCKPVAGWKPKKIAEVTPVAPASVPVPALPVDQRPYQGAWAKVVPNKTSGFDVVDFDGNVIITGAPLQQANSQAKVADEEIKKVAINLDSSIKVHEAGSPAQQAAIAINMKKQGKKPKKESVDESIDELARVLELSGLNLTPEQEFDIIEQFVESIAEQNGVDAEVVWEDFEALDDNELYSLCEDWQKTNKQDKTDGMSQKAVNAYRRENPGSKLKTAVTTKPSKLKKGSKASKRRSSYCSRSAGQKRMHHIDCSKTPDKAICKARRRWNC